MSNTHFTIKHRYRIEVFLELGLSARAISRGLGFSHTTINQELSRNGLKSTNKTTRVNRPTVLDRDMRKERGKGLASDKNEALGSFTKRRRQYVKRSFRYCSHEAQRRCDERRQSARMGARKITDGSDEAKIVSALLKDKWSPELIEIRSREQKDTGLSVSRSAIYGWIKRSDNRSELEKLLRRKGRKPNYRTSRFNETKGKKPIHTRPRVVDTLGRAGDLEGDIIVSRSQKDRLLTHVDRLTGVVRVYTPSPTTTVVSLVLGS